MGVIAIKHAEPVQEVVDRLRTLLIDAEKGELRSFVACCEYPAQGYLTISGGGTNPAEVVGMLQMAIFDRLHAEA